jgi:hypothetical protein
VPVSVSPPVSMLRFIAQIAQPLGCNLKIFGRKESAFAPR